ncbi:Yip1-domain-containing protein [Crepidotus variabilis]|uniref:Protein YIP n=1 Tax=Crepidotus variabilis TaxID=179855 RepID=A0A9P6EIN4_9AGAR|nr:Yip1-domain-containing protein [Crepidotus variabilis]
MWQEQTNAYGASPSYFPQSQEPLQFYGQNQDYYPSSRTSFDGPQVQGSMSQQPPAYSGSMQVAGPWYTAFGTGGFEGEPPLLEELGINFSHIRDKSLTVLNPLSRVDEHIMDDADLAGPAFYCFCFGISLLLSGKSNFNYIYGVALFGSASLYALLNLMSEQGIDAYRVASVLGYCLLPMVGVGAISVISSLDGKFGYLLSSISILWCTYAASGIFVVCLKMSEQRLLVAYPIGLLYGCFALLSVFNGTP